MNHNGNDRYHQNHTNIGARIRGAAERNHQQQQYQQGTIQQAPNLPPTTPPAPAIHSESTMMASADYSPVSNPNNKHHSLPPHPVTPNTYQKLLNTIRVKRADANSTPCGELMQQQQRDDAIGAAGRTTISSAGDRTPRTITTPPNTHNSFNASSSSSSAAAAALRPLDPEIANNASSSLTMKKSLLGSPDSRLGSDATFTQDHDANGHMTAAPHTYSPAAESLPLPDEIPSLSSKPQSLEALVKLIGHVGLEPFKLIWEDDDELDVEEFTDAVYEVLIDFVKNSNEEFVKQKVPQFYWMRFEGMDSEVAISQDQQNDALNWRLRQSPMRNATAGNSTAKIGSKQQQNNSQTSPHKSVKSSPHSPKLSLNDDASEPPQIDETTLRKQLENLFNRIDANSNQLLDWDEFSSYFLLGLEGERKMKLLQLADKCYSLGDQHRISEQDRKNFHKDKIQRIFIDSEHSTYYSLSEHGQVKRWLYVASNDSFVFLTNMTSVTNRVLGVQFYKKWVVLSNIARRFLFFDRVSGELIYTLVGRNGNKFKVRNGFENQNFVQNVQKQLAAQTSKTKDISATLERMKHLSKKEKADDIVEFKRTAQRTNYLNAYKKKVFGKKTLSKLQKQQEKKHRVYILESLGQSGGIPMSFCITSYKENEFDYHAPAKDILIIGTDAGTLKMYDISKIFLDDESIITKHKSDCMLPPLRISERAHKGWVSCVQVDTKEKVIITGSWDTTIKVWSMQYLSVLRTLIGHKKPVYRIEYEPKSQTIASVGREREIFLWKPHSPSAIDIFMGHESPVIDIGFNSKENQLVSLSVDQVIKVWDLVLFKCIQTIPAQLEYASMDLTCLSVDESRNLLATGNFISGYAKMITWQMKKNFHKVSQSYMGHKTPIVKVLWNDRYKEIVSCDAHSVAVWNGFNGKLIFKFHLDKQIVDMCFDHLKRRIVVSFASSKYVNVYNFYNGQCLKKLTNVASQKEVTSLKFVNLDAQREKGILGGTEEGEVLKWNDTEDMIEDIAVHYERSNYSITCLELVPPDNLIVGYEDGSLWLMSFVHGKTRIKRSFQKNLSSKIPLLRSNSSVANMKKAQRSRIFKKVRKQVTFPKRDSVLDQHEKENVQVEALVPLPKKSPILICARGNGVVTMVSSSDLSQLYAFQATSSTQDAVTALAVDENNDTLITGDSQGYVSIYDIQRVRNPQKLKRQKAEIRPNDVKYVLKFQAFDSNGISSVTCSDSLNCLIVGGGEKYVALYTMRGKIVGIFGQSVLWDLENPLTWGKEVMAGVNDKFEFGLTNGGAMDDDSDSDSENDEGPLTKASQRNPNNNSPLAARKNLYAVSPLTRNGGNSTAESNSTRSRDEFASLGDIPVGSPPVSRGSSRSSMRKSSPAHTYDAQADTPSLMSSISKLLTPIQTSSSRKRPSTSDNGRTSSRLTPVRPKPVGVSMDAFDNIEELIGNKIRSKKKELHKEASLPSLNSVPPKTSHVQRRSVKKSADAQNLAAQHYHARSKAVFENQYRKGAGYEKRLFSYLQVEKTFVDTRMFRDLKDPDDYWNMR